MVRAGFSLVELSIVLVILGLLTGGILTGQNLIRAAELRAVTTELQAYQTAVMTFRDKYFALPGDMRNATDFWGAAATCPPTSAAPLNDEKTCNGNGSGALDAAGITANEMFTFWQQLANAGLIEGTYTGAANSTTYSNIYAKISWNVPASKFSSAGWTAQNMGTVNVNSTGAIDGAYGHVLYFGDENSTGPTYGYNLKPEEMWSIDTKIDDGKPGTGKVVTREDRTNCYLNSDGSAGSTSTSVTRTDVTYNLSSSSVACTLIVRNAF